MLGLFYPSYQNVHLKRDKIDHFTGPCQSGFKRGDSCADSVWGQRMLVSVVTTERWDFHQMGIDIPRALDTIKHGTILNVFVERADCDEAELRLVGLVRLLLADIMHWQAEGTSQISVLG